MDNFSEDVMQIHSLVDDLMCKISTPSVQKCVNAKDWLFMKFELVKMSTVLVLIASKLKSYASK